MTTTTATVQVIQFYRSNGPHGFLSNLYAAIIEFEGHYFETAEHAYQYGKAKDPGVADWIVSAPKPHLVSAAAHALLSFDVHPDWQRIKVDRMRQVLFAKFSQHPDLLEQLVATGDAQLEETSRTDGFWGLGKNGNGHNMLGELLMIVRAELGARVTA